MVQEWLSRRGRLLRAQWLFHYKWIGIKNHGTNNGIFYKNRHKSDYFTQTTPIHPDYLAVNRLLMEEWQDKYVDLLSLTMRSDSTVLVFTPDHHFITYDGKHLTPSGARYYSVLLLSDY